ncbi:MAG: glycosyltransferase family 39 protein [Coxiellaceae bacterium]|nr:glycosyltransferase family 39 protein [Coxiellaceae bacterium]
MNLNYKKTTLISLFYFLLLSIYIYLFHFLFWKSFLPIQEGWFHVYSHLISSGEIPYKQFSLFIQPLYIYLVHGLCVIFGNKIIVMRTYGLIERIALACVIFSLYKKFTKNSTALTATILTIVFYTSPVTDVIYGYYQTCLLFVILSGLVISLYVKKRSVDKKSALKLIFFSGTLSGIAFITKQSTGMVVPFILLIYIFLFECSLKNSLKSHCVLYLLGFILPFSFTILFLYEKGALYAYFHQVWMHGASSKGGITTVLFGAFINSYQPFLKQLPFAFIIVLLISIKKKIITKDSTCFKSIVLDFMQAIFLFSAIFFAYIFKNMPLKYSTEFFSLKASYVFFIVEIMYLLSFVFLYENFKSGGKYEYALRFFGVTLASAIIYAHGMSGTYEVQAVIFALGLLYIFIYDIKLPFNRIKNFLMLLLVFLMVICTIIQRYNFPYYWWGWGSLPIRSDNRAPEKILPAQFKGMNISLPTANMYNTIINIIQKNTKPGDTIYEFPFMPIFYLISDRYPHTFSIVDYYDVCSDQCALMDLKTIKLSHPKVIIIDHFPESAIKLHEELFRGGKKSAQRKIIGALNQFIKKDHYTLVYTAPTNFNYEGHPFLLEVWVQKYRNIIIHPPLCH